MTSVLITCALVGGFLLLCGLVVIKNLIYICQPNEVLIFSGAQRSLDTRVLGYRLVRGGRGIRTPLFETVDRLDLTNMIIDLTANSAYAKGGIPLNVQAVANIKIAGDEPVICNAIERFLGKPRTEVMRIAKETLEGNLRGVLASLTPEQVNEDKIAFEEQLLKEAEIDLMKLGLVLDSLKIQNISDNKGYLDSIGRRQTADLLRRSRIAESNNTAESVIKDALNQQETAVAQLDAKIQVARAEAKRRIIDAETRRHAVVAEERSEVEALIARAEAELNVQEARIEQARRQLQADIVEPAVARRRQLEAEAKASVAHIRENGRATADALKQMTNIWHQAGDSAREIFLTQKLEGLVEIMVGTVKDIDIEKITMIDGNVSDIDKNGSAPMKVASATEQLRETIGVDVPALARGLAASMAQR